MLDECKGERLEEVLAVFSNVVVKKMVQEEPNHYGQPIAVQLAMENFSYTGERTVLSVLNLAHRGVMSKELRQKHEIKAQFQDFTELLGLKERQIVRRQEQLNESISRRIDRDCITAEESERLSAKLQKNWSGNNEWLQTILHGDGRFEKDGILAQGFDEVWKRVEASSVAEIEDGKKKGLLEQLDTRIKQQNHLLAKWESFQKSFSKGTDIGKTSSKISPALQRSKRGIDLKLHGHETLQIHQKEPRTNETPPLSLSEEYTQMIANMKKDLEAGGRRGKGSSRKHSKPYQPDVSQSDDELDDINVSPQSPVSPPIPAKSEELGDVDGWDSTDSDQASRAMINSTPSVRARSGYQSRIKAVDVEAQSFVASSKNSSEDSKAFESTEPLRETEGDPSPAMKSTQKRTEPSPAPSQPLPSESEAMADAILSSIATASPSPVKPKARHTLTLAERTRMSMVRSSRSDLDDLPDLSPVNSKASANPIVKVSEEKDPHADLIARTRQSMSGFAAAQKKADIDRRRSVKAAAKKARESSYFPPPFSTTAEEEGDDELESFEKVDRASLIEGKVDVDYDSVFKSRPKIALSPAVSPTKWDLEEEGLEDFEEESSPLRRLAR